MTPAPASAAATAASLRVALLTYSTKARGGVVHTLALAEALAELGHDVHVFALGKDGRDFFRPLSVPSTLIPIAIADDAPLDQRIASYIDAYHAFLAAALSPGRGPGRGSPAEFDVFHAQDCVSANALFRLREDGRIGSFVRTVHHVDAFTSPYLIRCQDDSILHPNAIYVVSQTWQTEIARGFARESTVLHNGVDAHRFRPAVGDDRQLARQQLGLSDEVVFLHIGGIEPRKNTIRLLAAYRQVRRRLAASGRRAVLLLAGGETLLDHTPYRQAFFHELAPSAQDSAEQDLCARDGGARNWGAQGDVRLLGTVDDAAIPMLYHAADMLVFPSLNEGWGLVALEAMASSTPVIASDLPVFREYLEDGRSALLVDPESTAQIADAMHRLAVDGATRERLVAEAGRKVLRYDWRATARAHEACYRQLAGITTHAGRAPSAGRRSEDPVPWIPRPS